jgi:hypothetical protein
VGQLVVLLVGDNESFITVIIAFVELGLEHVFWFAAAFGVFISFNHKLRVAAIAY